MYVLILFTFFFYHFTRCSGLEDESATGDGCVTKNKKNPTTLIILSVLAVSDDG